VDAGENTRSKIQQATMSTRARLKVHAPKPLPKGCGTRITNLVVFQEKLLQGGVVPVETPYHRKTPSGIINPTHKIHPTHKKKRQTRKTKRHQLGI
jgi:hypothetical protein